MRQAVDIACAVATCVASHHTLKLWPTHPTVLQLELRQAAPLHAFTLSSAYMAPLLRAQPSGDAGALEVC